MLDWLDEQPTKVHAKCLVRIERLRELGHELRRPEADYLRDGIYELRIRYRHENYRILYFFHGRRAVLSHGIKKKGEVPAEEIGLATDRAAAYANDPAAHTYRG